jgi:predicted nucleotide-binding protein (sugar kinase/HSP70/actin superfamily)
VESTGLSISGTLFSIAASRAKKETPFISGEILAKEEMMRGINHGTYGLAKKAAQVAKELNVDGFIWGYLFNCRPLALTSHLLKQVVEKETGIPTLSLEMDMYDSRSYSAASLKTRVETFSDLLRAKKMSPSH